jgi:hypothetical protein
MTAAVAWEQRPRHGPARRLLCHRRESRRALAELEVRLHVAGGAEQAGRPAIERFAPRPWHHWFRRNAIVPGRPAGRALSLFRRRAARDHKGERLSVYSGGPAMVRANTPIVSELAEGNPSGANCSGRQRPSRRPGLRRTHDPLCDRANAECFSDSHATTRSPTPPRRTVPLNPTASGQEAATLPPPSATPALPARSPLSVVAGVVSITLAQGLIRSSGIRPEGPSSS